MWDNETGIHRTIIRKIHKKALKQGWLDPLASLPKEDELEADLFQKATAHQPLDRFREKIEEWIRKDYSYVVIHRLVSREYECSEATVRRYIKKNFVKLPKAVMARAAIPGEIMEVDFGYLGFAYHEKKGRLVKAWLFSGRLRHSRKAYREIVFDQKQETFFMCHVRAFEYFGGAPKKVAPDNLKTAVIKASFESPIVNRVYQKLALALRFSHQPVSAVQTRTQGRRRERRQIRQGQFLAGIL
jgi:transposase